MSLNTSNEVMRRRHQKTQSRLPPVYDPQNLFATPGAGPSNPPGANQLMTSGAGGPVQPQVTTPLYGNMGPPRYVPIPPGHFSNPMENLIAASTRLAALPVDGDDPTAVETGGSGNLSKQRWLSKRPTPTAEIGFTQLLRPG